MKYMKYVMIIVIIFGLFGPLNLFAAQATKGPLAETGVLILAHGGPGGNHGVLKDGILVPWNQNIVDAVKLLSGDDGFVHVEVAFGMAHPCSIQEAVAKLEKAGVRQIVVVPLFISSHSPIIRQSAYLLDAMSDIKKEKANEDPIEHTVPIYMSRALDDNVWVSAMVLRKIEKLKLSNKDLRNTTVILVGHGPNGENDNNRWLNNMSSIAKDLKGKKRLVDMLDRFHMKVPLKQVAFKEVLYTTVRDDARKEVWEAARDNLRAMVSRGNKNGGKVIIAPLLISSGGVEKGIEKRLEGLDYIISESLLPIIPETKFYFQTMMFHKITWGLRELGVVRSSCGG